ncbi:MAG: hypothetical protein GX030_10645 [Firmicutes bacterium]|nr:hypothetical protein [Bacillota bacterium]
MVDKHEQFIEEKQLEEIAWKKYRDQVAAKLGLAEKIAQVGWDSLTAAECGQVGGKLNTAVGANLRRKIIEAARAEIELQREEGAKD